VKLSIAIIISVSISLFSFFQMKVECYGRTLMWDESHDSSVVGYKVYYGLSPGVYILTIDVGFATEYKLCGFYEGMEHYAAVTAYNIFGGESDFSNEVSYPVDDGVSAAYDNCAGTPNGRYLGTCVNVSNGVPSGMQGGSRAYFVMCLSDDDCETDEICQMKQEDYNNNSIGDACECYADFNNDGKVILSELLVLKSEFGKTNCATEGCRADFNGDKKVSLSDLMILKREFGRTNCLGIS
jgi:hypothetical protein